jgi:hypothetical protein
MNIKSVIIKYNSNLIFKNVKILNENLKEHKFI